MVILDAMETRSWWLTHRGHLSEKWSAQRDRQSVNSNSISMKQESVSLFPFIQPKHVQQVAWDRCPKLFVPDTFPTFGFLCPSKELFLHWVGSRCGGCCSCTCGTAATGKKSLSGKPHRVESHISQGFFFYQTEEWNQKIPEAPSPGHPIMLLFIHFRKGRPWKIRRRRCSSFFTIRNLIESLLWMWHFNRRWVFYKVSTQWKRKKWKHCRWRSKKREECFRRQGRDVPAIAVAQKEQKQWLDAQCIHISISQQAAHLSIHLFSNDMWAPVWASSAF